MGSHDGEAAIARFLAHRLKATLVSVGYRKTPEHEWPASINDAEDVVRELLRGSTENNACPRPFDRRKVLLVGMSAGGYHAIQLALTLAAAGVDVAGHVAIAPMVGPFQSSGSLSSNEGTSLFPVRTLNWAWSEYLRGVPPHTWDWCASPAAHLLAFDQMAAEQVPVGTTLQ